MRHRPVTGCDWLVIGSPDSADWAAALWEEATTELAREIGKLLDDPNHVVGAGGALNRASRLATGPSGMTNRRVTRDQIGPSQLAIGPSQQQNWTVTRGGLG
jgi:hypothetical protein